MNSDFEPLRPATDCLAIFAFFAFAPPRRRLGFSVCLAALFLLALPVQAQVVPATTAAAEEQHLATQEMAQNLERAAHRTSEIANMRMDEKHR